MHRRRRNILEVNIPALPRGPALAKHPAHPNLQGPDVSLTVKMRIVRIFVGVVVTFACGRVEEALVNFSRQDATS